jgi:hypothetical protein
MKLSCFATGTPKPNITWYAINEATQTLVNLNVNENYLVIKNLTRLTPRYYQCRASNGIPPNDNRNFTYRLRCMFVFFNGKIRFLNSFFLF